MSWVTRLHLGERDCSIKRRNQKVSKERMTHQPLMTASLAKKKGPCCYQDDLNQSVRKRGAQSSSLDQTGLLFYRMNTRIQVEHNDYGGEVYDRFVRNKSASMRGRTALDHIEHATPRLHASECPLTRRTRQRISATPGRIGVLLCARRSWRFESIRCVPGYTVPPY